MKNSIQSQMDLRKLRPLSIPVKLTPKAYFEEEDKYLTSIGVRTQLNTNWNAKGIHEGRLYFKDKETLKMVMKSLKSIGVMPVIVHGLTRIIVYKEEHANLIYYYLEGVGVDCQGVFSKVASSKSVKNE